jgi:uncharacterized coiled-coil DUF342 family protein
MTTKEEAETIATLRIEIAELWAALKVATEEVAELRDFRSAVALALECPPEKDEVLRHIETLGTERDNFGARLDGVMEAVRRLDSSAMFLSCTEGDHVDRIVDEVERLRAHVKQLETEGQLLSDDDTSMETTLERLPRLVALYRESRAIEARMREALERWPRCGEIDGECTCDRPAEDEVWQEYLRRTAESLKRREDLTKPFKPEST